MKNAPNNTLCTFCAECLLIPCSDNEICVRQPNGTCPMYACECAVGFVDYGAGCQLPSTAAPTISTMPTTTIATAGGRVFVEMLTCTCSAEPDIIVTTVKVTTTPPDPCPSYTMTAKDIVAKQDWSAASIAQLDMGALENCAAECTTQRQTGGERLTWKSCTAMSTQISFSCIVLKWTDVKASVFLC